MSRPDRLSTEGFSRRLKLIRTQKGLSQGQLAALCGRRGNTWVTRLELDKPENGRNAGDTMVTVEVLLLLASALDVDPLFLATGKQSNSGVALAPAEFEFAKGVGGPDVNLAGLSAMGLPGLEGDLLAIWPGNWINEEALPLSNTIVVCSGQTEPISKRYTFAIAMPGLDGDPVQYRYQARPENWKRQVNPSDGTPHGHRVLSLLPGPAGRITPRSSQARRE